MIRGKSTFKCPNCGHIFEYWDIEDHATAGTAAVFCPECGSSCRQLGAPGFIRKFFQNILNWWG